MGVSTFADYSEGTHVNFESSTASYEYEGMSFGTAKFYLSGNNDYVGTCAQYGVDIYPGGATMTRLSNSSTSAKAIYYFAVVQGWQDYLGKSDDRGAALQCIAHLISGSLNPYLDWDSNMGRQSRAEKAYAEKVLARYSSWENVQVPASFECYYCYSDDSNAQNVFFWQKAAIVGKLKLKKSSSNTGITG